MVRTPVEIIFDILYYIITTTIKALIDLGSLLGELGLSLLFISRTGFGGLLLAIVIGTLVFLFMWKFLFRTTISLIKAGLIYLALILILFGLIIFFTSY